MRGEARREAIGTVAVLLIGAGAIYLVTRKKKKNNKVIVLEPSGPPRVEPEPGVPSQPEGILEEGTEGQCKWALRTKDGRYGYWIVFEGGSRGSPDDAHTTLEDARVELGEDLVQLANQGLC